MAEVQKLVSITRCETYDRDQVYRAVKDSIDNIGGIGRFVAPGQKVFLKVNMLFGAAPDKCVSTHPEVVYAVGKILKDHGCSVIIGDSPGAGMIYNEANLRKAYALSGFDKVARELGVSLNLDTSYRDVPYPDGKLMKHFTIINPALDADAIVVVSKVKTHMWTYMSCAAKNMFGVIPGLEKTSFHSRFQGEAEFGAMLVDLNEMMKPRLQVVDAVVGMEGEGPMSGSPRKIGAILAGHDYSAVDSVVARIISIDPSEIGTLKDAMARGLIKTNLSDVSVAGGDIRDFVVADYKKPSTYMGYGKGLKHNWLLTVVQSLGKVYVQRPVFIGEKCIECGRCERSCPVKAITMADHKPKVDYRKCIKCYCCHEMCMEHAIRLERGWVGKALSKITGK